MQRLKQRVCPLLAVLTRRQWKWTMLCGALLAPPPARLGRRRVLTLLLPKDPPRRKEPCLPRETWPMTSWQPSHFSRVNGRWSRSTLSCRTQTSIICHGGVFSLCMSSYAFSMRIQLWLPFALRLGWWNTLSSFLVNGLSPLWSQLEKWPRSGTRNCFFSTRRITGSGPSGKTFTSQLHWTVLRAEIGHQSALWDVSARMLVPRVKKVQARGHLLSLVSVMYTSLSRFGWSQNQSDMCGSLPAKIFHQKRKAGRVQGRLVWDQAIRHHCRINTLWYADLRWRSTHWTVSHGWLEAYRAICAGRNPQAGGVEFPITVARSQSENWNSALGDTIQRQTKYFAHWTFARELANGYGKCLERTLL